MDEGYGGPVWHASIARHTPHGPIPVVLMTQAQQQEAAWAFAEHALRDVGDAALGEWREIGARAVHLRRRLTNHEWLGPWGMDLRETPEGLTRLAAVSRLAADWLYGAARMIPPRPWHVSEPPYSPGP